MKKFIKIFGISFICFTLLLAGVVIAILKMPEPKPEPVPVPPSFSDEEEPKKAEKTELEELIEKSNRINVLLMGMEGPRTDVLILASFDPESKNVDMVSVPRDTYFHSKGYNAADQKKINAVYGRSNAEGVMGVVSAILDVPVHHYVRVSYKGVEDIVDSLGGVKVTIPFNMNYDDPYSNPPLHIHFKKGTKVLNGKEAVKFLRHRKNNDGTHSGGDIGRIQRQQQFLKSAASKALSFKKLPVVASTIFKFVKTSMDLDEIVYYAKSAIGISTDNIKTYKLPGKAEYKSNASYYIHDPSETEKLMIEIYKRGMDE
ncbi:LCP family protein [Maledivibacter halophilus]|uniref:Transcriptional attenuator, LytR family n=1 Tax=Maledivibacter halophilus TaxID=36842 RepID=A0A1T5MSL8_9FIRM|nr:LCP family protein [Maledivibacter halophilus]SKC91227.1 transcriptional attenuator, LytR family [Maledivibacter halophilus]